jgi:hypothetical protein
MAGSLALAAATRAVIWGLCGTLVPALVELSGSNWFGAGDLRALAFFTLPLLLILAVIGVALARKLAQRPIWIGVVIGATGGVGVGFLWTLANALHLGPWFGAWSVPVLLCWTTGGALSLVAAATTRLAAPRWRIVVESGAYLFVAMVAFFVYRPAIVHLQHDQHLTLVYGRIRLSNAELAIDDSRDLLIPGEREMLALAAIGGSVELIGGYAANTTEQPRARVLVLLRRPVDRVYRLLEPDKTTVLYIQENSGFRRFPPDAKVLPDRAVEVYPADPNETRYWVEHAGGARSGGSGIQW